ncbi:hypothetical protein ACFQZC_18705 [Streptacidiphilus monticola]
MKFTVSQTRSLTDQAITVSWTGGVGTGFAGTAFDTDFVQIMQCWGTTTGPSRRTPGRRAPSASSAPRRPPTGAPGRATATTTPARSPTAPHRPTTARTTPTARA